MALDGVTIAGVVHELNKKILGGRIDKINQPEYDEIILSIRSLGDNHKLLLTANSSHPRIHLTEIPKVNPLQAPVFCMVLRKHLSGGKITAIVQPDFERIVELHIEAMNEMGDMSVKRLIIEIMGKHSNIILVNEKNCVIDSVKRISRDKSSVREVLPGKDYFVPAGSEKKDPMFLDDGFLQVVEEKKSQKMQAVIYQSYNGISPVMASEICFRGGVEPERMPAEMETGEREKVFCAFKEVAEQVNRRDFQSTIYYDEGKVVEFSSIRMMLFDNFQKESYESPSALLENYYKAKDSAYRMAQKTVDLRKLVQTHLERCVKKKDQQIKTLKEIANRDDLKINGELITSNIYSVKTGMTSFTTPNFYDDMAEITIALDPTLTPAENAQAYFKKYNKQKRTFAALQEQMKQNENELSYLDGVLTTIQTAADEHDIGEIREELFEQGFIKKRKTVKKKAQSKSKPLHFVSSEGFEIYVGKNNKQNDELTLKFAVNSDIWMHTKEIPGSHVIIRTEGKEPGSATIGEGALLAAFYSKARNSSQVPVDYAFKKNVKKPNGAKPGMVIYEMNKTVYVTPEEKEVEKLAVREDRK